MDSSHLKSTTNKAEAGVFTERMAKEAIDEFCNSFEEYSPRDFYIETWRCPFESEILRKKYSLNKDQL